MDTLIDDLLAIMDDECSGYKEWEKNKPIIIKIYIGGDNE